MNIHQNARLTPVRREEMAHAAQRDAQTAAADASGQKAKRQRKRDVGPRTSDDELAAF